MTEGSGFIQKVQTCLGVFKHDRRYLPMKDVLGIIESILEYPESGFPLLELFINFANASRGNTEVVGRALFVQLSHNQNPIEQVN